MNLSLLEKHSFLKLILFSTLLLIFISGCFIAISIVREPDENDHLPQIVSDQVSYERVNEREYFWSGYKEGSECSLNQMNVMMKKMNLAIEVNDQYHKCHQFKLENGTIYWLQPTDFVQQLVLEKPADNYQLILSETQTAYPGPVDELSVRADSKAIIFRYEGYHNPRKIVRLRIKDPS